MLGEPSNKYRNAVEILQRGRDVLVEEMTNEILDREDELVEGGFLLNEFLEAQGTRLHFLCLLVSQLEQSAEALDEVRQPAAPVPVAKPVAKRQPRTKKLPQQATRKGTADEQLRDQ
jgi:3-phosphoglycerate kinase